MSLQNTKIFKTAKAHFTCKTTNIFISD